MSRQGWIDREAASRMSLAEIGALLVRHRLLDQAEIPHMSLREMHMMLAYLAGVRPNGKEPGSKEADSRPGIG
jgi:hypothetical protein